MRRRQRILLGLAVFAISFAYVWWIAGDVFNLGVDEGIYLEGGRRVAAGQTIYRDFFVLTGPLTFWIEGGLARWVGILKCRKSGTQSSFWRAPRGFLRRMIT